MVGYLYKIKNMTITEMVIVKVYNHIRLYKAGHWNRTYCQLGILGKVNLFAYSKNAPHVVLNGTDYPLSVQQIFSMLRK